MASEIDKQKKEKDKKMDTGKAEEALQAFSSYSQKIEKETKGAHDPSMRIFSDGSGRIIDEGSGTVYVAFGDFVELLHLLEGEL